MKTPAEIIDAHAKACDAIRAANNLRDLLNAERAEFRAYLYARWHGVESVTRFAYEETPVFVANRVPDETCDVWRIVPRDG
jgi:hypothetical protein